VFLVDQDHLIVWLLWVMADRFEWVLEPREAATLAYGVGIMFSTKGEGESQGRLYMPLILAVESQKQLRGKHLRG
jgi:hypothetical protein